jgi:hypothetical protein
LMNRYEAPQKAERSANMIHERRGTGTRIADSGYQPQ